MKKFLYLLLLFPFLAFGAGEIRLATSASNGTGATYEATRVRAGDTYIRTLIVSGTFDSAVVTYQISPDGSTWVNVSGATSIAAATAISVTHRARYHRIVVASGLGSESIDVWVL